MSTSRTSRRVKTSQWVKLLASGRDEGATSKGEARLSNLSAEGVCLEGVTWESGAARPDDSGLIDVHIPYPDWVGMDLKIQPVRLRLREDSVEIGAVIVRKPPRYDALIDSLGYREPVEAG